MSEQPAAPPPRAGGGGNVFTHRIGPFPMWVWLVIVAAILLAWRFYAQAKQSNTAAAQATPSTPADQVPQFVNQTYTTVTAPSVSVTETEPVPSRPLPTTRPQRSQPEPATITSTPGSFTTGLPGGLTEWTSPGKYSLNVLAKSHGMTAQQLLQTSLNAENNVGLRAYAAKNNYNAPVPSGVHLYFPLANWKQLKAV